jgi:hypothetical protein
MIRKMAAKSKMTLDKLARIAQDEFLMADKKIDGVRKEIGGVRKELGGIHGELIVIREDSKQFATKDDLKTTEVKILHAVDKIVTRFDTAEKDHTADKLLHDRHERRMERIETKIGIR